MNDAHLELLASDEWRDMLREHILPFAFGDLRPGDLGSDVLEIGPGPGLTTELLSPQVGLLTALELDHDLADALAERWEADPTVVVVPADATVMPFDDDRFSGAVSFTMLHHVPEPDAQDRIFAEIRRVLRPGGLFVASDSRASDDLAALHVDDIYNPVDPLALESRLTGAGFVEVDVIWNEFGWGARARA